MIEVIQMVNQIYFNFIENQELVSFANSNLKRIGKVVQAETGYVYLKVDDDFIHRLFPMIQESKKEIPNYFLTDGIGAHSTVLYADELKDGPAITEIGTDITFEIGSFFKANILGKTYYGITIISPQLSQLRKKYGLDPDRLNFKGFKVPFHITIGVWKP